MSNNIVLEATGLYKVFGRGGHDAAHALAQGASRESLSPGVTAAVIDASFSVKRGEIFMVMGLSGSGKSTLIRMLNGLLEPTAGHVSVLGRSVTDASPRELREIRRRHVSMVFQHFALLPHRTVIDNVAYGLEIQDVGHDERLQRAKEITSLVGLSGWEEKFPSQLSGGMQQRVGLARALATDSDILLMDEAFSALDPLIRREMQDQLLELQSELGKTIVFITHDLNEAMYLGARIAVMRDGRIVQVGTPEDILTNPANHYVEQFVQDVDRTKVLTAESVMRPARAVIRFDAGPRAALKTMRDEQVSGTYVIAGNRQLRGWVRDRDVLDVVRSGGSTLDEALREDHGAVPHDTALADLFIPSLESALPLAVLDDKGRLAGVVPRVTLLAALGGEHSADSDVAPRARPLPTAVVDEVLNGSATQAGAS